MSHYKPVSKLLTTSKGELQSLLERAHYLQALTRALQEVIDPAISQHIIVANLRDDVAVVAADSPAWLTKIRYLAPIILQQLQQQQGLETLRKIQFKVQPPNIPTPPSSETRQASLSTASSKVLESAADGINDPDLADALRRLSHQNTP